MTQPISFYWGSRVRGISVLRQNIAIVGMLSIAETFSVPLRVFVLGNKITRLHKFHGFSWAYDERLKLSSMDSLEHRRLRFNLLL